MKRAEGHKGWLKRAEGCRGVQNFGGQGTALLYFGLAGTLQIRTYLTMCHTQNEALVMISENRVRQLLI